MPLQGARDTILALEPDPSEMHRLLSNLDVLGHLGVDDLAQEAVKLYSRHHPAKLVKGNQMRW